jgi:polysaccharide biosynthesis transport protein
MDKRRQLNGHDSHESQLVLQSRNSQMLNATPYADPRQVPIQGTDDFALLLQFAQLLWKRKWVLVATVAVGALVAIIMTLSATPIYTATASLAVDNIQEPFTTKPVTTGDPMIMTQVQFLSSDTMRERALARLRAKKDIPPTKVIGTLASLRKILGLKEPATTITWQAATFGAAYGTRVTNPRDTRILIITSQSPNPQAAAAFADALAEEFIQRNKDERWESYKSTGEWLNRAEQELKSKVEQSDQRMANFAKSKGLVFTGTQNVGEDKLKLLQSQLLTASADRITKESVWQSSQNSPTESLPSVLDSGPMSAYQTKLTDLRRELAELSATLTPSHYRTQRVQAQIDELEKERTKERANIISRIRIEYEAALKRENELRRLYDQQAHALAGQADDIIQYNLLQREAETNKKLYEMTLQQGKEASLASAMRTSNVRIVDPAFALAFPVRPNFSLNLSLGMFCGLLGGVLFVFLRSRMNAKIQSPGVLELHMNLRELGVIPAAAKDPGLRTLSLLQRGNNGHADSRRTKLAGSENASDCVELVTWNRKPSLIAEAFRATMTSILFSGENGSRPKVFVITSAVPQEGKSTVISNLAIALAEINHRVLLIDADMRLPRLHSIFDLPNTLGLSDILHEPKPVKDLVIDSIARKTQIPDLYILPAGPARMNLSRLLHSARMEELITRMREMFDTILIDTAPVLSVPDSRILARVADGVILVVRAHQTHQDAAFSAVKRFAEDGHPIFGTILNDWDPKLSTYGEYGSYSSYYSQYLKIDP